MHKKFPKCIGIKTFLLECVAAMLMSIKILQLDKIFKEFITILLTHNAEEAQISITKLYKFQKEIYIINEMEDNEEEGFWNYKWKTIFLLLLFLQNIIINM